MKKIKIPLLGKIIIADIGHGAGKLLLATAGSDYVQNLTAKVPLRQVSLTLTWKFGNTKKQFQQRKSNINNDFKEEQQGLQVGSMTGSGSQEQ